MIKCRGASGVNWCLVLKTYTVNFLLKWTSSHEGILTKQTGRKHLDLVGTWAIK